MRELWILTLGGTPLRAFSTYKQAQRSAQYEQRCEDKLPRHRLAEPRTVEIHRVGITRRPYTRNW